MKPIQARSMSADEIDDGLERLRREALNLRFQRATGQLEKVSRIRATRREIALLETVKRERIIASAAKTAASAAGETAAPAASSAARTASGDSAAGGASSTSKEKEE